MTVRNPIREGDGDERHGTWTGYINHGCRCAACVDAGNAYQRDYRTKTDYFNDRIPREARRLALAALREHAPDLYRSVMDEARRNVEARYDV